MTAPMDDAALDALQRAERAEAALAEKTILFNAAITEGRAIKADRDALRADVAALGEALLKIVEWGDAYPITVFPEPDLKQARRVLEEAGMTLDSISAGAMRHAITGAANIARAALAAKAGG